MIRSLLFTAALCGTVVLSADWIPVNRGVKLPWDLEATSLQIKTDSEIRSGDQIEVELYDKDDNWSIGTVSIRFSFDGTISYNIDNCVFWTELNNVPTESEKIWTITKTGTALTITCNGVEVVNYKFADSARIFCERNYGGDTVKRIMFSSRFDSASQSYRAGETNNNTPDWIPVERGVKLPWDLETTSLEIKTDSTLGSGDLIAVQIFGRSEAFSIGGLSLRFTSPMKFYIHHCERWTDIATPLPVEANKIWKITKTGTGIIITCNDVEVVNYKFADSPRIFCERKYGGDVVEKIMFSTHSDTASRSYRAGN